MVTTHKLNITGLDLSENFSDGRISSIALEAEQSTIDCGFETQQIALSEVSPGDKPWDKHRAFADRVESLYAGTEFNSYSTRIHFCSQLLEFGLAHGEDALKLKLRAARFCRVARCPVCQWRRSLMWKAKAFQVLPKIVQTYPTHRWLFVTFTQKNVPVAELRDALSSMNKGYQRMIQRKLWPGVGWLRSTEVTRGRDGNAHPHFHCLVIVPASYFSGQAYLKKADWIELWRDSMRFDYKPIMDVRAVKSGDHPSSLIPELLKYVTKESDLVADREWFLELTRQLHKMRLVATGGILKEFLRELEEDSTDLIGDNGEQEGEDLASLYFGWRRAEKKYRMVD